jgi:septum formation topological specificity factor MinE
MIKTLMKVISKVITLGVTKVTLKLEQEQSSEMA